tara:strand:+ start:1284 stop:2237 length:954 start_codon:yes stop_codon:yes gene_type:complete
MEIEPADFENPLPTNLSDLRRSNERRFYSQKREFGTPPDTDEIRGMMDSGFDGLARYIVQNWIFENGPDVKMLELLVSTNDMTIPQYMYLDWCGELLELDPDNEVALESILMKKEKTPELEEVQEITEKLLRINPNNSGVRKHKIVSLVENGSFESALEMCEEIIGRNPDNDFALRQRGIICTHMGKHEEAAFFWSEWLDKGRAPLGDSFRAARAHYNARHFSECISLLEEIVDEFSEEERVLDLLIRAKYSIFDWNSCFDLCEELLEKNSRNPTGLKYMRLTRARVGDRMTVVSTSELDSLVNSDSELFLSWFEYL